MGTFIEEAAHNIVFATCLIFQFNVFLLLFLLFLDVTFTSHLIYNNRTGQDIQWGREEETEDARQPGGGGGGGGGVRRPDEKRQLPIICRYMEQYLYTYMSSGMYISVNGHYQYIIKK